MSRVWQLVRPKKVVASTAALVMVVSLVNLSGLVPLEAEAAVAAEPTPAPTTISLTTSRTVVAAGQTARLVATVDNAVQDSSSVIEIIDTNTNGVVALCSKGRSCTQDASIDTGGPHTYLARVGSIESELVTIERETWTVELSASRSTLLAGQSSTLEAVASQSVGKTNNAFAIYIFDTTNGTLIATCAGGKTCKATVPTLYDGDGGRARSFVAVVASTGNPARLEDAENIQATSTTVGIERVPWVLSLRSSATEVVVGGSARITAVANQDVADTMGQYSLYIVDVQNDDRVVECATGRRCRMTVTWAELGQAQSLAAFIAAPGAQSFDDLQDIQAGSDAVHLEQTPWSVALTSNRDTAGAGDLILVQAETNQNLSRASGAYSTYIFEASTDQLVKRCEVGTVCVVTDRLFGPEDDLFSGRLYHAVVGLTAEAPSPDDVQDVRALSNWVTVDRVPWTLTVTRGDDVLLPDGKVQFTAATNQSLDKTFGRDAIYFFDAESGEVLGECLTGTGCVAAVSGNLPAGRSVFAVVAERTQPGSFDEARSIQASSNAVTTTDTFWSVSLETNTPVFAAGASATLTATANHDLDATFKNYEIAIFDTTSGTVVKRCVSGTTCSVETSFGAGGPHRYQAIIAAAGATTVEAAIDLQAVSEVVELTREPWKITLTANKAELLAGETAVVTAVANQDIGATNGQYQLTIFDETTGIAVKTCQSTTICVWEPQSLYFADGLHDYVALLMDAAYVNRIENATGVQATSNELSFEIAPWILSLVADVREFVAGEYGRITASGNQNIGLTGGSLAIYYFDKSDGGKRVGDCTELGFSSSGTNRCSASVSFYDSQSHTFVAVVAKKTNPATLDDAVGVLVTSNTVQVSNAPWSAHLTATPYGSGYVRLVAGANQSPWRTNGTYSLYIVRATGVSSYCNPYLTCDVFVGLNSGESFTAVVASADPPYLHNVLARSATFFAPVTGGPTDVGETAGGGNPSESNCQCSHGDPVNTATGEFYHPEQDLSIPGVGPALGVQRTYSSTYASVDGPFGYGWSTNFSSNLTVLEEGNAFNGLPLKVRIIQENGSSVTFTRDSGGEYRAPLRVQATLTFDEAQQTWTFIRHRTQVFEYDAHGRLSAVKDLNGNAVTLSHDSAGNVVGLSASGGRSVA